MLYIFLPTGSVCKRVGPGPESIARRCWRQFPWAPGDALNVFLRSWEMHKRKYLTKSQVKSGWKCWKFREAREWIDRESLQSLQSWLRISGHPKASALLDLFSFAFFFPFIHRTPKATARTKFFLSKKQKENSKPKKPLRIKILRKERVLSTEPGIQLCYKYIRRAKGRKEKVKRERKKRGGFVLLYRFSMWALGEENLIIWYYLLLGVLIRAPC